MIQYDTEAQGIQETQETSLFDSLRNTFLVNIKHSDCIDLLDLIDMDVVERTKNDHLFDSVLQDMDLCSEMLIDWYRKVVFHGNENAVETPSQYKTPLDWICDHKYTVDDAEILLDIYQEFLIRAELYEAIQSISHARLFLAEVREQLQKWEQAGWDNNRILEKLKEVEKEKAERK